jgi:hypothetical protein
MSIRIRQLCLVLGAAFLLALISASAGFAKTPKTFSGSGSLSFVSAAFSYDGLVPGVLFTGSGKDNLGGPYTFQCVAELHATTTSCTAPDGSAGTTFDAVQTDCALTYKHGQLYISAVGAAAGSQCISNTTGLSGGSVAYTVTGGTRRFTGASGSFGVSFTNQTLAAPGSPAGSKGIFGAGEFTESGSLTK